MRLAGCATAKLLFVAAIVLALPTERADAALKKYTVRHQTFRHSYNGSPPDPPACTGVSFAASTPARGSL